MKKKRFLTCLMGVALALSLFAFIFMDTFRISVAGPPAPNTIKVGSVLSLTGSMAAGGKWTKQGYEIGLKHINEAGGIYVKDFDKKIPLEIIFLDDESDPKKTVSRMEKLYSVDKVDAFLGGFSSFLIVPQLAVAEKYRIPILVNIGSTAEFEKGYKYVFTPFVSDKDQVTTFLEVLDSIPQAQRPNKIAFFEIQEEWGVATGKYLKEFAPPKGYKIVTYEKYAMNATDFSSLIVNAKAAEADIIYTNPTPPQGIGLVKQMKEIDWAIKFAYILRAADVMIWSKNLGKDGDYVCHNAGGWDYHLKLPGVERFNQDYKTAYGSLPENIAGPSYACLQMLADAIQRAGNLDRDKIREAIASTNLMTIMGQIRFKPNGRGEGNIRTVSQWQNGKDEMIWPKDQASAPLAYPMPPWKKR
jgi:branched-chain amino acid transport system substrate-binding protein